MLMPTASLSINQTFSAMLKIIFQNGHVRCYNDAHYLRGGDDGTRHLYDSSKCDKWIATIMQSGTVVEAVEPCWVEGLGSQPNEIIKTLLNDLKIKKADGYLVARLKKALEQFDAKQKLWKS